MTLYNLYMMTMAGAGHTMLMSAGTWGKKKKKCKASSELGASRNHRNEKV